MIEVRSLRKEFGDATAVCDVDLHVARGEMFGLAGCAGAGKTTLLRLLCGLVRPTSGSVCVVGVNVHAHPEEARPLLGYVPERLCFYNGLTVRQYLEFFAGAYRISGAAAAARIDEVIEDLGLSRTRGELVQRLSPSVKQRVAIARAVLHRPKVLILDEPATDLDPRGRGDLRMLLSRLHASGLTILISSISVSELEGCCSSLAIMEQGQLLSCRQAAAASSL